jgi:uracil-DNA glycosylase
MEGTVYLEDIEVPRGLAVEKQEDGSSTSKPATVASTQLKRQRTLVDMFHSSQGKIIEPSAKKPKLSASFSSSSSKTTASTGTGSSKSTGLQKLNSIPFSLASFQESLKEEEKNLLKLECEVMGKSW